MVKSGNPGKVGDLLVDAGVLTPKDLADGMELSATLGLPIGKTMVMSGVLSEKMVRSAVLVHSMLKDGLIEKEMATTALAITNTNGKPVEECLLELGWRPLSDVMVNKIGQLLLDGKVISAADLRGALEQVNTMGLPLSRVLVLTGKVNASVIWCVLNAQILLRDKKINRKQAISAVKGVHERQMSFEQTLKEQGLTALAPQHRIKLGELLVLSGLVGEEDILGAVEDSVIKEQPLGQVLVDHNLLTKERLSDALKLQEMTDTKALSPLQSVDVLRSIHSRNYTMARAVAELGLLKPDQTESLKLGELLKMCGWITENEIDEAVGLAAKNSNLLGKMLVAFGFIDENMLFNTLRCQFLVREGFLKSEQAVIALHYAQRTRCSLDQAVHELGYATIIPEDPSRAGKQSEISY